MKPAGSATATATAPPARTPAPTPATALPTPAVPPLARASQPPVAPGAADHSPARTGPATVAEATAPSAGTTPAAAGLGDRWYAVVRQLCSRGLVSGLSETLAVHSGLQRIDDGVVPARWTLRVERETLRAPALRDKLAAALALVLEQLVDLELEAGAPDDSPHRRDTAERARRQAAAVTAIESDPVVRDLLAQFSTARIVPGSIKPV